MEGEGSRGDFPGIYGNCGIGRLVISVVDTSISFADISAPLIIILELFWERPVFFQEVVSFAYI